jgi:GT2 family glycosyltransferase/glycosyltransferase involved in cell wall biosynthesis
MPIRLALSRKPLVSVIIPTYGQVAATLACLRSLAASPPDCPMEVIVIDDAYAGPEDLAALSRVEGIVLLRNRENLGYLRSCNAAAKQARGDYLHLLNNDTEIRPGAVDALLSLLQSRPDAGLAGSKLVYPDGRLQEAGAILWQDASGWNYGRGEDPQRTDFTYVREADYCSAASVMIARDLWDRLGGFDEAFLPAYYEDADLAFRVRAAGLKVLYEPRSEVVHHEGVSHGTDLASGVKAAQLANQARFVERWGPVLAREHYPNGTHVLRAAARGHGRKVALVIDHYVPEPDRDAGSRSALGILQAMLDAGWVVKLWPHNRLFSGAYTTDIEAMGIEVIDHRWPGDLAAWLHEYGDELDHLLTIRPDIAVACMPAIVHRTDAVMSFYGVDLHFARMRRQAELDGDEQLRRDSDMVEQRERRVWRNFDVVIYPSEEEAATVRQMAPQVLARGIVPFWFETAPARTQPPPDRTILFVAGFAHPPNTDAALFLMQEVIPRLEAEIGVVRVTLAGSKPSEAVRALAGRDVEVTGYVTDAALHRLYDRHRVAVVPLRFGAGVKGKVVESLSRGLPVVTTSTGAQGIEGLDQVVPVVDDPAAIVAALKTLLTDDAAWVAQSARQVAFAQERFSRAAMGRSVIAALEAGEAARAEHRRG